MVRTVTHLEEDEVRVGRVDRTNERELAQRADDSRILLLDDRNLAVQLVDVVERLERNLKRAAV